MATKRKRESISYEIKRDICNYAKQNPKLNNVEIGSHFGLTRTTIRDIIQKPDKYEEGGSVKHAKKGKFVDLEQALLQWFTQKRAGGVIITDLLLKEKATQLGKLMNVPDDFTYSNGWLHRFKTLHGISQRVLCGEGASVSTECSSKEIKKLNEIFATAGYEASNIYNVDETALFYRLLPNRTLAKKNEACHGLRKNKQRITIAVCCNADGTDKQRLLIIGKSKNPRCFKSFNSHLYCTYTANSKAWMTAEIFQEWLNSFNCCLRKQSRHIVLLLDNATSHKAPAALLSNIKLHFLPPNMTSSLQPLDAGIINSFKSHYRKLQLQKMVELADAEKLVEIGLDDAVRYCKIAWDNVSSDTILHCWNHIGIPSIPQPAQSTLPTVEYGNVFERIGYLLHITTAEMMSPQEFANVEDLLEARQTERDLTLEELATLETGLEEDEVEELTQDPHPPPSIMEAKAAIDTVLSFLEHEKTATEGDINSATFLLRRLQCLQERGKRQTVLTEFFKPSA